MNIEEALLASVAQRTEDFYSVRADHLQGICSGFPECCIEFYINWWKPRLFHHPETEIRNMYWKALGAGDSHPHYIACPECLYHQRFVEVQECHRGCYCKKELRKLRRNT